MGVQFDPANKHILITSPTAEVTALELYNAVMDWCDEQPTMGYDVPMSAVGKFDMGGGIYSDSIFMLINGWKIKPWSGTYSLLITGTLLPEPGESRTIPPDSGNVDITFQVSSQGTVVEPAISEATQLSIAVKMWDLEERGGKLDSIYTDVGNHLSELMGQIATLMGKLDNIEETIQDIPEGIKPKASFRL